MVLLNINDRGNKCNYILVESLTEFHLFYIYMKYSLNLDPLPFSTYERELILYIRDETIRRFVISQGWDICSSFSLTADTRQ